MITGKHMGNEIHAIKEKSISLPVYVGCKSNPNTYIYIRIVAMGENDP